MEIPTNDEGMFEAVDGGGTVVGHGIVADGVVDFAYTDGTQEARAMFPVEHFATMWSAWVPDDALTLRAAE